MSIKTLFTIAVVLIIGFFSLDYHHTRGKLTEARINQANIVKAMQLQQQSIDRWLQDEAANRLATEQALVQRKATRTRATKKKATVRKKLTQPTGQDNEIDAHAIATNANNIINQLMLSVSRATEHTSDGSAETSTPTSKNPSTRPRAETRYTY